MKFYDIHVNDGVNSYSVFTHFAADFKNQNNDDIIGVAVDLGKLDPDDIAHVDNVTEIDLQEYQKATADLDLTEDEKKAYLKCSHKCPRCKSDDITGGSVEINDGEAWQSVSCGECEISWTDIYTLARVEKN